MQHLTPGKKFSILFFLIIGISFKSFSQCKGNLIFYDEFEGSTLNTSKWNYDTGNGCPNLCGWGNNEKEYYTNSTDNVSLSGGFLNITARYSPGHNGSTSDFTSGKIHTKGKFDRLYGRFEARMKMPTGLGLWPAFWLLPTDNSYGGWPTSGEIDIMEYRGDHTNQTDGTVHYGAGWPNNLWDGTKYTLPSGSFNNEFHVFAVEWEPGVIRWYVDNTLIKTETQNPNSLAPASNHWVTWPWDKRFYIILNLALGGWFTGNPDTWQIVNSTTWPQTMQVDYVRVYDMSPTGLETPYLGTIRSIPGKIEAEHYNDGCNTNAYNDVDASNNGGQFRGDGVDIEATNDGGPGYNVGWTAAGEWLNYKVNVNTAGKYSLQVRVASEMSGKSMHVEMDGVNISGAINIPNTGGWQTWQTVTVNNIDLTAGNKNMRVVFDTDGININYLNFTSSTVNPNITFNNSTKTYGDAAFNVGATSNSSGAITYSITSGGQYATITSNGQVTIKGAGTVTIQASQAAASGYNAGTKTATLTINKKALTATADNKARIYNTSNPAFTITYSGFVYGETASALNTQPSATTTATMTSSPGTYPINLNGGSSSNYTITLVNGELAITRANPTLTYNGATSGWEATSIALSATTNSTGAITYSVTNGSGSASIAGTTLNLTTAGTVTLTINMAATTNYHAASVNQTITINAPANPVITFNNINKTYGDPSFNVNATSNSPGAITYSISSGSQFASITPNGEVIIFGVGPVTIQANQAAAAGYKAATATATLTIYKAMLTATADDKSRPYNTANPEFTITYSGFVNGENTSALTFQPLASTSATPTSNAGTYPITLTGGSSSNYTITLKNGTLTITTISPTITYTGDVSGTEGTSIALSATSNSSGAISYSVTNGSGQASVSGTTLNLTKAGTVTLTVSVAASGNYSSGSVSQNIIINPPATDPVISFANITKTYGDGPFSVSASSNSSGAITYSITSGSQYASITSQGSVTILGAGSVTILATQAASSGYNSTSATSTLTINKAQPLLTYTGAESGDLHETLTLSASHASTGAISYHLLNSGTGNASLSGDQLTLTQKGTVIIEITINEDANYLSQTINKTITIYGPTDISNRIEDHSVTIYPNPATSYVLVELNEKMTGEANLTLTDIKGKVLYKETQPITGSGILIPMTEMAQGLYLLHIQTTEGLIIQKVTK